jgi:hypothetical protein
MSATGTAIIDFGGWPGTQEASVSVTGQTSITSSNVAEAWMMGDTTSDHNEEDHEYANLFIGLTCDYPVNGVGFSIEAKCIDKMQGTFMVHWIWA